MSLILFFIIFFICTGVGKIFLQINSAAVAFIDILIAAWEGLKWILGWQAQLNKNNNEKDVWMTYEPHHDRTCLMAYANNKGADQLLAA